MKRANPWLLLVACALSACGGGGSDSSSAAPPDTAASSSTPPSSPASSASSPSAPTADITCGMANFQAEALQRINAYRAQGASCGTKGTFPAAAAVAWNTALANAAYGHSKDMADNNYFSHTSQDGRTFDQRITAAGYSWHAVGENIAAGQPSVQVVVDGWMKSDGHCANIMTATFKDMGLACARNASSTYGIYWTLDLGAP